MPGPGSATDLAGSIWGRWTVLGFAHRDANRNPFWHCVCACGTCSVVGGSALLNGGSTQCQDCKYAAQTKRDL